MKKKCNKKEIKNLKIMKLKNNAMTEATKKVLEFF